MDEFLSHLEREGLTEQEIDKYHLIIQDYLNGGRIYYSTLPIINKYLLFTEGRAIRIGDKMTLVEILSKAQNDSTRAVVLLIKLTGLHLPELSTLVADQFDWGENRLYLSDKIINLGDRIGSIIYRGMCEMHDGKMVFEERDKVVPLGELELHKMLTKLGVTWKDVIKAV